MVILLYILKVPNFYPKQLPPCVRRRGRGGYRYRSIYSRSATKTDGPTTQAKMPTTTKRLAALHRHLQGARLAARPGAALPSTAVPRGCAGFSSAAEVRNDEKAIESAGRTWATPLASPDPEPCVQGLETQRMCVGTPCEGAPRVGLRVWPPERNNSLRDDPEFAS